METHSTIGALLPLWLLIVPVVIAFIDLSRTRSLAHRRGDQPSDYTAASRRIGRMEESTVGR